MELPPTSFPGVLSRPRLQRKQSPFSLTVRPAEGNGTKEVKDDKAAQLIAKIEDILEDIVDALRDNRVMTILLRSRRSGKEVTVSFPAANSVGARRFAALLQILYFCHESLASGNIITKRNIYYQNPDLFETQDYVDRLVDDVAYTFGVGRDALNIVAASKGLIAGAQFDVGRENHGVPIPQIKNLDRIDLRSIRWVLVIEKEATFRGLVASRYFETSAAGPGILLTAKGYPDLASRQFLHLFHSTCPQLLIYTLVDFDPDGIAIMRTYKRGSQALDHEKNVTIPDLLWLGIKSRDLFNNSAQPSSVETSSHMDLQSFSSQSTLDSRPSSDQRPSDSRWNANSPIQLTGGSRLTASDRKKATRILRTLDNQDDQDAEDMDLTRELQLMLMTDLKFEIQALDEAGNLMKWLDKRLLSVLNYNLQ